MAKLTAAQVRAALPNVPGWKQRGRTIARTYAFRDFAHAMRFVRGVARRAERARHHPDIAIQWNRVTLTLTTHDAGGLTEKDFLLAGQFDVLANLKSRT